MNATKSSPTDIKFFHPHSQKIINTLQGHTLPVLGKLHHLMSVTENGPGNKTTEIPFIPLFLLVSVKQTLRDIHTTKIMDIISQRDTNASVSGHICIVQDTLELKRMLSYYPTCCSSWPG